MIKRLIKQILLVAMGIAFLTVFHAAKAAACSISNQGAWGVNSGSSRSDAGLVIHTQYQDGSPANVGIGLHSDAYSIWQTSNGGSNNVTPNNYVSFSTGSTYYDPGADQCDGYLIFGYGNSNQQGNTYALDCEQVTSGGGYTAITSHFWLDVPASPDGSAGSWATDTPGTFDSFTVSNGYTKWINLTWIPNPQITVFGFVMDRNYNPVANVPVDMCGVTVNTDTKGYYSHVYNIGDGFCARASGYNAIHNVGTNVGSATYEWQVAGKDCFNNNAGNCANDPTRQWDRNVDSYYDFVAPPPPPPPAPNVSSSCSPGGDSILSVNWNGDGTSDGYTVEIDNNTNPGDGYWYYINGTATSATIDPPNGVGATDSTNFPLSNLKAGSTYQVDVYYNHISVRSLYTSVVAKTGCVAPPPPTVSFSCSGSSPMITISWGSDGSNNYNPEITTDPNWNNYWFDQTGEPPYGPVSQFSYYSGPTSPGNLTITAGQKYYVRVYYWKGGYNSPIVGPVSPSPCGPPPPPALTVRGACNSGVISATISWPANDSTSYNVDIDPSTGNFGGQYYTEPITGNATSTVAPSSSFVAHPASPPMPPLSFTAGANYAIRVSYFGGSLNAKSSQTYTFSYSPCGPPTPPTLTVSGACNSGVITATISWPVNDSTSYNVDIDPSAGSFGGQYYTKGISGYATSTGAPSGFVGHPTPMPTLTFTAGANYAIRVSYFGGSLNATSSQTYTFSYSPCAPPVPLSPYFTTNAGNVNAGGGFGTSCLTASGSIKDSGAASTASIVTAINNITGFSASVPPFLIKPYHPVCRPDIYARLTSSSGQYYRANYPTQYALPLGAVGGTLSYNPSIVGGTFSQGSGLPVVWVHGDLVLDTGGGATPVIRQTIVVDGNLIITGKGIYRDSVSNFTLANLPTLGIVAKKDIFIEDTVQNLYGYYVAGTSGWTGTIHTCTKGNTMVPWDIYSSGTPNPADVCSTTLSVNGALFASDYDFRRTGTTIGNLGGTAETVIPSGDLYLNPPPGLADVFVLPQSEGEKSPKL